MIYVTKIMRPRLDCLDILLREGKYNEEGLHICGLEIKWSDVLELFFSYHRELNNSCIDFG